MLDHIYTAFVLAGRVQDYNMCLVALILHIILPATSTRERFNSNCKIMIAIKALRHNSNCINAYSYQFLLPVVCRHACIIKIN